MSSPAAFERATVFEATQIAPEATPGVAVPALKQLLCTSIDLKPKIPVEAYRPYGFVVPTTAIAKKEWSEATIEGKLCLRDHAYLLSGNLCRPTIITPGGATLTRRWTWFPQYRKPDRYQTFSIEKGNPMTGAGAATYGLINALSVVLSEDQATIGGAVLAQELNETNVQLSTNEEATVDITGATAGNFKINPFGLGLTANIARNASLATVQAAVDLIAGAGNTYVYGTTDPLPGAFKIQARGDLGQQNLTNCTADFTGLTGGTNTITTTTPGVAPTLIGELPVSPTKPDIYIGSSVGSLAQLDRCDKFEFGCSDRFRSKNTLDSREPSFTYAVQKAPNFSCNISHQLNSYGIGLLDDVRNTRTKIMRLLISQDEIETGFPFRLQYTFPFKFLQPDRGDNNDVYDGMFEVQPVFDPSFGGWLEVVMDTDLTAL